jgi:hypothetical protein
LLPASQPPLSALAAGPVAPPASTTAAAACLASSCTAVFGASVGPGHRAAHGSVPSATALGAPAHQRAPAGQRLAALPGAHLAGTPWGRPGPGVSAVGAGAALSKSPAWGRTPRASVAPPPCSQMVGKLRLRLSCVDPNTLVTATLPLLADRHKGAQQAGTADLSLQVRAPAGAPERTEHCTVRPRGQWGTPAARPGASGLPACCVGGSRCPIAPPRGPGGRATQTLGAPPEWRAAQAVPPPESVPHPTAVYALQVSAPDRSALLKRYLAPPLPEAAYNAGVDGRDAQRDLALGGRRIALRWLDSATPAVPQAAALALLDTGRRAGGPLCGPPAAALCPLPACAPCLPPPVIQMPQRHRGRVYAPPPPPRPSP